MRRSSALQACIAHQQSALTILHQCLQDQPHSGPDQPASGEGQAAPGPVGIGPNVSLTEPRSQPGSSTQQRARSSAPSSERRTILQVARESRLTRLIGLTSELLNLEQNSLYQLQETHFHLESKLSVELRNICSRMATREDCLRLDGDLKEIEQCLRDIVNQLLLSLSSNNSRSHLQAIDVLKGLFQKFLNI
ncbi:leukemia-associated protein 7 [Heptranchias perlo]|uniref:leukemia-associated protein 7 n=1 Tax=Heptranchias perlo TaxID=212740 RepID=UPI00355A35CB